MPEKLLPCPFCGGEAGFEEVSLDCTGKVTFSVGCQATDGDCIGYQMLAHYSRKREAAEAWNRRAPSPIEPAAKRLLKAVANLGECSNYNGMTFFEVPLLSSPEQIGTEAIARWQELDAAGKALKASIALTRKD